MGRAAEGIFTRFIRPWEVTIGCSGPIASKFQQEDFTRPVLVKTRFFEFCHGSWPVYKFLCRPKCVAIERTCGNIRDFLIIFRMCWTN